MARVRRMGGLILGLEVILLGHGDDCRLRPKPLELSTKCLTCLVQSEEGKLPVACRGSPFTAFLQLRKGLQDVEDGFDGTRDVLDAIDQSFDEENLL